MIVRTVLGDIVPKDLGVTYAHEHLIIESRLVQENWPHIYLPSVTEAVAEATVCAEAGVGAMLDAMPTDSGRNLEKLAAVSRAVGIHVIASTGMHSSKYYEGIDWAADPTEELALRFIPEVLDGVGGIKAGVMKVALSAEAATEHEGSLFLAAGMVHIATGAPILTHCEDGRGALAQIEMLRDAGVAPARVLLSHTDKVLDRGYHREILQTGASVEYDQALRQHLVGSTETASLIADMWGLGFGSQILLGTDGARRSLWATLGGGPGLSWLADGFDDVLRDHGLGELELEAMLISNPARALSFNPPR